MNPFECIYFIPVTAPTLQSTVLVLLILMQELIQLLLFPVTSNIPSDKEYSIFP
jgi:hypothetical protein